MAYDGYACLSVRVDRGVAFVTIDHPPINLLDARLIQDLDRLGRGLEIDDAVRVVVVASANPDFFIAHADVTLIQRLPTSVPPRGTTLGPFHQMVDRFRTMPKATIGQIEGRARGGGSEFLLSLDMRFAALGRAVLAQPEVALGIIPGGSGTQRLPRLVGRGRASRSSSGAATFLPTSPSATATSTARCPLRPRSLRGDARLSHRVVSSARDRARQERGRRRRAITHRWPAG